MWLSYTFTLESFISKLCCVKIELLLSRVLWLTIVSKREDADLRKWDVSGSNLLWDSHLGGRPEGQDEFLGIRDSRMNLSPRSP